MQEKVSKSQKRYGDMVQALNRLYWDSEISPEEIVACLEQFGAECFRLAGFVKGNIEKLDPLRLTRDEAVRAVADESPKDLRTKDYVFCPRCAGTGKVTVNSGRRYPCGLCNGSGQVPARKETR